MNEFKILAFIMVFLHVIYDTDALPYYLGLINKKFFKTEDFFNFKQKSPIQVNYLEALAFTALAKGKRSFWLELLACSSCLTVWMVFLFNFACNLGWYNIGYEVISVWVGYALLKFILKKLYE